jgi:dipeptidase E
MLHEHTRIVACGGVPLDAPHCRTIHRFIRDLTGIAKPRALLIPTATYDNPEVYDKFRETYGKRLGCQTSVLYLLDTAPSKRALREAIEGADLIWVSGGNTLKMMRRWRRLGVDRLLQKAHRIGTVLAGSSAGALCWFEHGHSDSQSFYHPENWGYIRVRGLGFIPGTGCPHVLAEDRMAHFQAMMWKHPRAGIAIDNDCAVAFVGREYRVLTARRDAKAFRLLHVDGTLVTREIPKRNGFRPVGEIS